MNHEEQIRNKNREEYFRVSDEINTRKLGADEKLHSQGVLLLIYNDVTCEVHAYRRAAANSNIVKHDCFIMTVSRLGMEYLDTTMYNLIKEVYDYHQGVR